jgi:DNA-binding NarL/FixJ family response regulator
MKRITILLSENHTFVREGFRKFLEFDEELEVLGETQECFKQKARLDSSACRTIDG